LPTSFNILFSEAIRGNAVDIEVHAFVGGQEIWLSKATAIADVSSIEMLARFCGDGVLDADRPEQCDDGDLNSDVEPEACRSSCLVAFCGDAVIDAGEACDEGASNSDTVADACRTICSLPACGDGVTDVGELCDDGNLIDADGCEADCTLPACGNGIVDPEDFLGATCYEESTFLSDSTLSILDVKIFDIDLDGFQDVIYLNSAFENNLRIAFGDGQGSFQEERIFSYNSLVGSFADSFGSLLIGEFAGSVDVLPDIAIFNSATRVAILKNIGNRNFTLSFTPALPTLSVIPSILDASVADFDSDGRLDLVVITRQDGSFLYSTLNAPSNGFNSPIAIPLTVSGLDAFAKAKDLNNDGKSDIIFVEQVSNAAKITIGKGQGNGTFIFSSINLPGIGEVFLEPTAIEISDRNNDGQLDITIPDDDTENTVTVFTNNCVSEQVTKQDTIAQVVDSFQGLDADLDGVTDFLMRNDNFVFMKFGSDSNDFLIFSSGDSNISTDDFKVSTFGDLNNDGILDIVYVRFNVGILLSTLNK
jgi:cysteine-rich repeat protein